MTVSLVLLRHAKSSWDDPALADHDRPLSARGVRDTRRIAVALSERNLSFDEVLCSSALRTRETWQRVRAELPAKAPDARILKDLYLPSLAGFRAALATAKDTTRSLLVVCHSPVIDAFVLSHGSQLEKHGSLVDGIPTGSFVVMRLSIVRFAELAQGNVHGPVSAFFTPRARQAATSPVKSEPLSIDRHTSVRELACLAFERALTQLRSNTQGATGATDPEFGHHLRVAVRKLRLYVKLFAKLLGKDSARHLSQELRWLFTLVGDLRDRDVLAQSALGQRILASESESLRALAQALRDARERDHAALRDALEGPRYRHLVRDLVALTAELDQPGKGRKEAAHAFVAAEVERRVKRVKKRAQKLGADDYAGRHDLRKALKKLRYTAELARGALRRKPLKAFVSHLNVLQDELGAQNDARVAAELIARASASLPAKTQKALSTELPLETPALAPLPALSLKSLG